MTATYQMRCRQCRAITPDTSDEKRANNDAQLHRHYMGHLSYVATIVHN